jgi:phosphatidate phosphatase APP1
METRDEERPAGWVHRAIAAVERTLDRGRYALYRLIRRDRPRYVVAYEGFGNESRAWLGGRVHYGKAATQAEADDGTLDNVRRAWRRWETDEIPYARVRIEVGGATHEAEADDEGYFFGEFELAEPLDPTTMWHDAVVTLVGDPNLPAELKPSTMDADDPRRVTAGVVRPPRNAGYVLISDVDDTVLHTQITDAWAALKKTVFENAFGRAALPGVAALYQAVAKGTQTDDASVSNPVFYVSSSAWNLYDAIRRFIDIKGLPAGPIMLRDLGVDRQKVWKTGHEHKLHKVERIGRMYPGMPLVLFGDSGQKDAELYVEAIRSLGGERVRAIFIRDIDPDERSEDDAKVDRWIEEAASLGVPMHRIADSVEAADLMIEMGLIEGEHRAAIESATRAELDEAARSPDPGVVRPGGGD